MTPSLPRDLLTAAEQKANEKRQAFYSITLWFFCGIALMAAFIVFGLVVADTAFERGVKVERERNANTVKAAPADCKAWLRHCAAETLDAWKKPWRKPA